MIVTTGLRAVLYLRISVDKDSSTSIDRQRDECRAWCEREGATIVAELVDNGFSGGAARERQSAALAMLHDGAADVLVVAALDRWSRQGVGAIADLDAVLTQRERANTPALFVALRDGLRSDAAAWRIIGSVMSEVARAERESTSKRTTASLDKLARERRWRGGSVPWGYRAEKVPAGEGVGWRLVVDEDAAAIIRDAAARIIAGQGPWAVSRDLNREGVRTQKGGEWHATRVRETLIGPRMVGRSIHRGEVVRDADGTPAQFWPPVLELETWERVRAALGADVAPAEREPRRRRARLLSGIVRCSACGTVMYVNRSGQQFAYQCELRQRGSVKCERWTSINCDAVERVVAEQYLDTLGERPAFERVVVAAEDAGLAEITRAIVDVTAALGRKADAETFAQLQALQARRDDVARVPSVRRVELRPTGESIAQRWAGADMERRRAMIEAVWPRIMVGPTLRAGRNPPVRERLTVPAIADPATVVGENISTGADVAAWSPESPVVDLGSWVPVPGLDGPAA